MTPSSIAMPVSSRTSSRASTRVDGVKPRDLRSSENDVSAGGFDSRGPATKVPRPRTEWSTPSSRSPLRA